MAGYLDTRQMIIDTLMGRPEGTQVQPEDHQAYALNMLNYIRAVELASGSSLIGIAEADTVPIEPYDARVSYIAGVAQNRTVTFTNFKKQNSQPISITTGDMEAVFVILLWNTQYWEYQVTPANIISSAEHANFQYFLNIRKTYSSVSAMNADAGSHIATDGSVIKVGETVSVHNTSDPTEDAIYSLEITSGGVYYYQKQMSLAALDSRIIDGGRADTVYGGTRNIDCGGA